MLRRPIAYSDKVSHLSALLIASITDCRPEPRISTATVAKASLVMFWARMGSLNALEMSGGSRFSKRWLGQPMPSAGTVGAVHSKMDAGTLREAIQQVHLWGFETKQGIAGRPRHRVFRTNHPFRTRRPHSVLPPEVTRLLVTGAPPGRQPLRIPLDREPQFPGEDEVATAMRLREIGLARH